MPRGTLDLGSLANSDKSVTRLELLQGLSRVVNKAETSRLSPTVLCAETENGDLVLGSLVQLGELVADFILRGIGTAGV